VVASNHTEKCQFECNQLAIEIKKPRCGEKWPTSSWAKEALDPFRWKALVKKMKYIIPI
jgi:hypothetical protein